MKISYSVKNLRRIKEMPLIEMKPLTILVGRNSAGKSTFLRSLPLIRQSLETRSSAPILWSGDYVDYGNFETVVSDNDIKKEITFSFSTYNLSIRREKFYKFSSKTPLFKEVDVSYSVGAYNGGNTTCLKGIVLSIKESDIKFEILFSTPPSSSKSVKLNGYDISYLIKGCKITQPNSNLFALPNLIRETDKSFVLSSTTSIISDAILSEIAKQFPEFNEIKYDKEHIFKIEIEKILFIQNLNNLEELKSKNKLEEFKKVYAILINKPESRFAKNINLLHKLHWCFAIFDVLEEEFDLYFKNVSYIGPERAVDKRFYRKREIEVSEIYPDGQNVPVFLDSLTQKERNQFSDWVSSIFGYGIDVTIDRMHISIVIKSKNKKRNIADVGHGVSQLLPVLARIWLSIFQQEQSHETYQYLKSMMANFGNIKTIAIEQPETHLHPAHQAKLADALVNAISKIRADTEVEPRFLIETHSSDFMNRIGEIIEYKKENISHEDVQILIFEPTDDDNNSPTEVKIAKYNEKGLLTEDWPVGFFNY